MILCNKYVFNTYLSLFYKELKMAKNVTISVDEEVYEQAKAALKGMGLTFSGGVELFLRAVAREDAIPFPVKGDGSRVEYAVVTLPE